MTDTKYLYQYFLKQSLCDNDKKIKPDKLVKKTAIQKTAGRIKNEGGCGK